MSAILQDPLLSLRPMTEQDVAAVLAIEEATYEFPWTEGIFKDCLRVGYCCWVCVLGDRVVGYGLISVAAGECHVLNLCIDPEMRSRGLGRYFMTHLLNLARQHKAEMVFLEVRPSNEHAIALYESMGFNEVGRRRRYYPAKKGREDALILARNLVNVVDDHC
jgi:ribosomal-protein-alanine N-acetyltransferase